MREFSSPVIYFAVFFIVFVLNYFAGKTSRKHIKRILPLISFAVLVGFVGIRDNVGTDYYSYINTYNVVKEIPLSESTAQQFEPVVAATYKALSNVFEDYRWIFFMYAILSILPIYLANKEYKNKYLAYSVLIFCLMFFPFTLNIMRQGVSFGFTVLSAVYLSKNKKIRSMLSFLIGLAFHFTSIVTLPFLLLFAFLHRLSKEKKYGKYAIMITLAVSFAIAYLLKDFFIEHGMYYGSYLTRASYENISFAAIITYLPALITIFLYRNKSTEPEDKGLDLFIGLIYAGIIFQVVGTMAPYVNRIALFFLPILSIFMPISVQNIKDQTIRRRMKIILVLYLISFFMLEYVIWGRNEILPYQTWLLS